MLSVSEGHAAADREVARAAELSRLLADALRERDEAWAAAARPSAPEPVAPTPAPPAPSPEAAPTPAPTPATDEPAREVTALFPLPARPPEGGEGR